jgi:hypothetical protein
VQNDHEIVDFVPLELEEVAFFGPLGEMAEILAYE